MLRVLAELRAIRDDLRALAEAIGEGLARERNAGAHEADPPPQLSREGEPPPGWRERHEGFRRHGRFWVSPAAALIIGIVTCWRKHHQTALVGASGALAGVAVTALAAVLLWPDPDVEPWPPPWPTRPPPSSPTGLPPRPTSAPTEEPTGRVSSTSMPASPPATSMSARRSPDEAVGSGRATPPEVSHRPEPSPPAKDDDPDPGEDDVAEPPVEEDPPEVTRSPKRRCTVKVRVDHARVCVRL